MNSFVRDKIKLKLTDIDWDKINLLFPLNKSKEHRELRKILFNKFDKRGKGWLTLIECEKGIKDVLKQPIPRPCVLCAYHISRDAVKSVKNKRYDDE